MIQEAFAPLVDSVLVACQDVYDKRLRGVVIFGSVARGTASSESDLDLLVVAEPLPDGRMVRMEEFDRVETQVTPHLRSAWRSGTTTRLSPIVRTLDEVRRSGFLLFDIAEDGLVVLDPDGRVDAIFSEVRSTLKARGAERRSISGSKYWVLEPNVRPGQVIHI